MLNSVNNTQIIREIEQPQKEGQQYYISYRGTDYERTPDADSFESENKTGKTVGIIAGVLGAAALVVGGICLHKGTKALEGKDASFGEKLKEGWKELWGRGKGGKTGGKSDKPEGDPKPNNDTSKPEGDPKTNKPESNESKPTGSSKPDAPKTDTSKPTGSSKPDKPKPTDSSKPDKSTGTATPNPTSSTPTKPTDAKPTSTTSKSDTTKNPEGKPTETVVKEPPKAETPKAEPGVKTTSPGKVFNRADYPCQYTIKENGQTLTVREKIWECGGDEHLRKEFYTSDGELIRYEISVAGKPSEIGWITYENKNPRTVHYINGKPYCVNYPDNSKAYFDENGVLGPIIKPKCTKLPKGFKPRESYMVEEKNGQTLTVREEISECGGDEHLRKEFYTSDGELIRYEMSEAGKPSQIGWITYENKNPRTVYYINGKPYCVNYPDNSKAYFDENGILGPIIKPDSQKLD